MTRSELYALVWAKPMVQLAKEFGLSDVGLRKICHKHNIPTPPLGYWAKLAHGKKVVQPSLPPIKEGTSDHVYLVVRPQDQVPEAVLSASEEATVKEADPTNVIVVPNTRPEHLHKVAMTLEKFLRRAMPDTEGFINLREEAVPETSIGPSSIDRAVVILDTLLKVLPSRGHDIDVAEKTFRIVVSGEPFALRLYEGKDKVPHVPTKDELKAQAQREESRRRFPSLYSSDYKAYRTWDYQPSGRLSLEITNPAEWRYNGQNLVGRWHDRANKKLEDYLGDVMVALATGAATAKHRRGEKERKERERAEEEARRQREADRLQRAKKRHEFIGRKAMEVEEIGRLEALHEFLSRETGLYESEAIDRLGDEIEETIALKRADFAREALNEEIARLGLYSPEELDQDEAE